MATVCLPHRVKFETRASENKTVAYTRRAGRPMCSGSYRTNWTTLSACARASGGHGNDQALSRASDLAAASERRRQKFYVWPEALQYDDDDQAQATDRRGRTPHARAQAHGGRAPPAPGTHFLRGREVAARYGINAKMTLWRWLNDPAYADLEFPAPRFLARTRRFWAESDLIEWERRRGAQVERARPQYNQTTRCGL
jgi:predicted DNA-binding transcriptional regulator AlpA